MSKLDEYLAGVKGRCEKATKGPWTAEGQYVVAEVTGGRPNGEVIGRMEASADHLTFAERRANANLAAHARTDVEALLKMVEALRQPSVILRDGVDATLEALVPQEKPK